MKCIGMSKIGLVRQQNEDRFTITDHISIVTDGMGGYKGGEIASSLAIDEIKKYLDQVEQFDENILTTAIMAANQLIWNKVQNNPELKGMGTTAVLVAESKNELYWANVGDSRLYIFKDQILTQVSTDHSMVQELYAHGQLTKEEAQEHPKRNLLTRAVGVELELKVDSGSISMKPGDRILLCSDGLTGYVTDEMIASVLTKEPDDERAIKELIDIVYDLGAKDNVTIIIGTV